jgi:N-acetyl-gamma-glutamyl-phosphate reductase
MERFDISVWGASGYAGQELVGILEEHPNVGKITPVSREMPDNLESVEVAFLALPHGESGVVAAQLRKAGSSVIDLSGDFRFETAEEYEKWYHQKHPAPELLPVPYALPELSREELPGSKLIAAPGCYPTAVLLGIMPLINEGLIGHHASLSVEAVSGVSGMGKARKKEGDAIINYGENTVYATGREHRHIGEIERHLGDHAISSFVLSVGPYFRGLRSTTTVRLARGADCSSIIDALQTAYTAEPFVAVLGDEQTTLESVTGTNMCLIGVTAVGDTVEITSYIDNLRKGASSQAVQGFNAMHELPEDSGLSTH